MHHLEHVGRLPLDDAGGAAPLAGRGPRREPGGEARRRDLVHELRPLFRRHDAAGARGAEVERLGYRALLAGPTGRRRGRARPRDQREADDAGPARAGTDHRAPSAAAVRGSGPNAGGGMRRRDAASYAEATFSTTSSRPGSARNTSENGRPGSGSVVGVLDGTGAYRIASGVSESTGS